MDNAGGAMISWTVLSLLRALDIRAKRTIRCVLFTCEEFDHVGVHNILMTIKMKYHI